MMKVKANVKMFGPSGMRRALLAAAGGGRRRAGGAGDGARAVVHVG
jgi:hypothetical protein